jgi:hypothetical protein
MAATHLSTAERLALATVAIGIIHHVDHVLRFDHSGWPFKPEITPFTYSLAVYVLIALVFALRRHPKARVVLALLLFLFPTLAHVFLETPFDQYHTWAHEPGVNLLHVSSPLAGAVAVLVTILLSGLALATLIAFWRESREYAARRSRPTGLT